MNSVRFCSVINWAAKSCVLKTALSQHRPIVTHTPCGPCVLSVLIAGIYEVSIKPERIRQTADFSKVASWAKKKLQLCPGFKAKMLEQRLWLPLCPGIETLNEPKCWPKNLLEKKGRKKCIHPRGKEGILEQHVGAYDYAYLKGNFPSVLSFGGHRCKCNFILCLPDT